MNILKAIYIAFSTVNVAVGAWAFASWIDVLFNSLYQPWNLWVLLIELTA